MGRRIMKSIHTIIYNFLVLTNKLGRQGGKTYIAVSIGNLKQAKYVSSYAYFCPRG